MTSSSRHTSTSDYVDVRVIPLDKHGRPTDRYDNLAAIAYGVRNRSRGTRAEVSFTSKDEPSGYVQWLGSRANLDTSSISFSGVTYSERFRWQQYPVLRNARPFGVDYLDIVTDVTGSLTLTDRLQQGIMAEDLHFDQITNPLKLVLRLGVLVLPANKDAVLQEANLNQEVACIRRSLGRSPRTMVRHIHTAEIGEIRNKVASLLPEVVHFCGLGDVGLHDGAGNTPASLLIDLFRDAKSVRCVVLSGCCNDPQARQIVRDVDCLVGLTCGPQDQTITFTGSLYRTVGNGLSLGNAWRSTSAMCSGSVQLYERLSYGGLGDYADTVILLAP